MKRIVSALVITAMILAMLLSAIPTLAVTPSADPVSTYKVNWKDLVGLGTMRAQWVYERQPSQNNYEEKYTVTATDTELISEKKAGDTRLYYSEAMVDITADTYYVYEFEVNSLNYADGGVIFAFAANPNAHIDGDKIYNIDGSKGTVPESAYFLMGHLSNGTDASVHFGRPNGGYEVAGATKTALSSVKKDGDGWAKYKVVYDGLKVKLYYVDTNGNWVEFFADKNITLVEGSKIAVGVSTWSPDWVNIRNCVVTAYNDVAAANLEKTFIDVLIKKSDSVLTGDTPYTEETIAVLETALAEAKKVVANTAATAADISKAYKALTSAIDSLAEDTNFNKLQAAVDKAESLDKADYKNWTIDTALAEAKAVLGNADADQATVDKALKALNDAIAELIPYRTNVLLIDVEGYNYPTADAEHYKKITDKAYFGEGNVFYYDYHKFVAAQGITPGTRFTKSLGDDGYNMQGSTDFVLRLGNNVSGSGTNRVADGEKGSDSTPLSHRSLAMNINDKTYNHVFGFSFLKAPTVDSISFYLPTDTKIVSIDVYGAVRGTTSDGKTLYGKANEKEVKVEKTFQDESATTVSKVYLGTVNVPTASSGDDTILASGNFVQAYAVEYIYFAITLKEGSASNAYYEIYEIELFGLNSEQNPASFKELNKAYAEYLTCVESDYTPESWAIMQKALEENANGISSSLATQAEVDKATAAINEALNSLIAKGVDKGELAKAILKVSEIKLDIYTPATKQAVLDALTVAEEVFMKARSGQNVVNAAEKALNDAIKALELLPDKTELREVIDEAKTLTKEQYGGNAIAWKMFASAVTKAEEIYADVNATIDDIDNAKADILSKKAELVVDDKYVPEPEPKPETEAPEATDTPATDDSASTDEGGKGCGSAIALSALAIVGVFGTAIALKKKED